MLTFSEIIKHCVVQSVVNGCAKDNIGHVDEWAIFKQADGY